MLNLTDFTKIIPILEDLFLKLGILNSQLFRNVVEIVKNAIQRPYFVNKVNTLQHTYTVFMYLRESPLNIDAL